MDTRFDQVARQAAKLDAAPFLSWVLSHVEPPPRLRFDAWDDTRRVVFPGEPARTEDLLAKCTEETSGNRIWLSLEVQTEPDPNIEERLGIYLLSVRLEKAGPAGKPLVSGLVLNLTGHGPTGGTVLHLPGTAHGLVLTPKIINLSEDDAAATLAAIAAGRTGRCILPWVPLMKNGGERTMIEEWQRVALMELDEQRRLLYAGMTLVFAELTRSLVNWQQALEDWNMRESQVVLDWKREGEQEGELKARRAALLEVIQARLADPVPEAIRLAIEGTNDLQILSNWLRLAATVPSVAELRNAMTKPELSLPRS